MKKALALVLAFVMVFVFTACNNTPSQEESGKTQHEVGGQIVVGSVTDLDDNMMDGWTNGAQNASIRNLIFGYAPVVYTKEGTFEVDPQVAESVEGVDNEDGTKTFTIKLQKDLKWNDAIRISIKDYVFSILLHTSPAYYALEAQDTMTYANCFTGYDAYFNGETKTFSGVRLIDDYTFSVQIVAEELPFHFDIAYASIAPYPMAVIAPDCDITDDGNGATISDNFTAELLQKTINDTEEGYRYYPTVTCGAYEFVSYDKTTKQAVLQVNDQYKGTYDGVKPSIEKIILKSVTDATQMDELKNGTVDLISGVSGGTAINAGLDICDAGDAQYASYLRGRLWPDHILLRLWPDTVCKSSSGYRILP